MLVAPPQHPVRCCGHRRDVLDLRGEQGDLAEPAFPREAPLRGGVGNEDGAALLAPEAQPRLEHAYHGVAVAVELDLLPDRVGVAEEVLAHLRPQDADLAVEADVVGAQVAARGDAPVEGGAVLLGGAGDPGVGRRL